MGDAIAMDNFSHRFYSQQPTFQALVKPPLCSSEVLPVRRPELTLVTKTLAGPRIEKRDFAIGCSGTLCTSLVLIRALGTRGRLIAVVYDGAACHA